MVATSLRPVLDFCSKLGLRFVLVRFFRRKNSAIFGLDVVLALCSFGLKKVVDWGLELRVVGVKRSGPTFDGGFF